MYSQAKLERDEDEVSQQQSQNDTTVTSNLTQQASVEQLEENVNSDVEQITMEDDGEDQDDEDSKIDEIEDDQEDMGEENPVQGQISAVQTAKKAKPV